MLIGNTDHSCFNLHMSAGLHVGPAWGHGAPIAHTCVPAWGHGSHMRPSLMNWTGDFVTKFKIY